MKCSPRLTLHLGFEREFLLHCSVHDGLIKPYKRGGHRETVMSTLSDTLYVHTDPDSLPSFAEYCSFGN